MFATKSRYFYICARFVYKPEYASYGEMTLANNRSLIIHDNSASNLKNVRLISNELKRKMRCTV